MQKTLFSIKYNLEIENLVIHLTALLENWDKDPNVSITYKLREDSSLPDMEEDSIKILAMKINSANTINND